MEIILFQEEYGLEESLENFLNLQFTCKMNYFASDLLENGLTPTAITNAVSKAMAAGRSAGLDMRGHFYLMYTEHNGMLVRDCKMSRLGYALVLLNADVKNNLVAQWQVKVLEHFLANMPISEF